MDLLSKITVEQWLILVAGIFAIAEFIVRLTPTEKDNSIVSKIKTIVDAIIPNLKKGGGRFF